MNKLPYVSQLLPDLHQARLLRSLLNEYVQRTNISDEDKDAAYEMLVKLSRDINHANGHR